MRSESFISTSIESCSVAITIVMALVLLMMAPATSAATASISIRLFLLSTRDFKMDFTATDFDALERICSSLTLGNFVILNETIRLLERDLSEPAIWREDVKHILLGHSLGREVTNKESRALREPIPFGLGDILFLLLEKFVITL